MPHIVTINRAVLKFAEAESLLKTIHFDALLSTGLNKAFGGGDERAINTEKLFTVAKKAVHACVKDLVNNY